MSTSHQSDFYTLIFLSCSGNVVGYFPYVEGETCTACDNDGGTFWCDTEEPRGLCIGRNSRLCLQFRTIQFHLLTALDEARFCSCFHKTLSKFSFFAQCDAFER